MIITVLINYEKIYNKNETILPKVNSRILKLFDDNEDFTCIFNIFTTIVNECYENVLLGYNIFFKNNINLITYFINVSHYS